MADDETEERSFPSLYGLFRKIMMVCAIGFVLWIYATKSLHTPPHPAQIVSKSLNTAIENAPPAPSVPTENNEEMARLHARIDQLEARLEKSETQKTASEDDAKNVEHLEAQIAEQEKSLQEMKAQIGEIKTQSNRALSALTAFGILKETVQSGNPFVSQLEQLAKLAPSDERVTAALEQLKPYAEKGIPTLPALQNQFEQLLPNALSPDAKNSGWKQNLQSLIRIRKVGEQQQGDDNEAILARAEAKLNRRDIAGALKETEALSAPAAEALAPWTTNAQALVAAGNALDALQLALAAVPNA